MTTFLTGTWHSSGVCAFPMTARLEKSTSSVFGIDSTSTNCLLFSAASEEQEAEEETIADNPWAAANWKFVLNFGRQEESTTTFPDNESWGRSGGRLVLPVGLTITPDRPKNNNQQDAMLQRNTFALLADNDLVPSTYITSEKGEQRVDWKPNVGEWKLRLSTAAAATGQAKKGAASKLLLYLDLPCDIQKQDVVLKKGERIYLTAKCWREDDLEQAIDNMIPIARRLVTTQERLEAAMDHVSGDRRLDGVDPIETLMGMKDTAQLVFDRDAARAEYQDAQQWYPDCLIRQDASTGQYQLVPKPKDIANLPLAEGPWPGQVEWLSIEPLDLLIRRQRLFFPEEYYIVGQWEASPILEDDAE